MTSKAEADQPLSNYKEAGTSPEDDTEEGEMRPEGSTDEQARQDPVEGTSASSSLSHPDGYTEGHLGRLGNADHSHTDVGGDHHGGGDGDGEDDSDYYSDDYDDSDRREDRLQFYYNNQALYESECYMIANPVVMQSMIAEFRRRAPESRSKAKMAAADKERLLECMRRAGDNDRAGLYEKEAALKLAEEKKHQADANNAAYKAANLAKLTVSEVDCSEMPEDMDSAQNFMEENLNLYDGVATEPGGEALVIITDQAGQPTRAGSVRQNIVREAVQQWRFYSRHLEKEGSIVFLLKAPKDHRYF